MYIMCNLQLFVGFVSSYFFMSTYLSMSVIGFEIWKTFTEFRSEYSRRYENKRYILYALYVWSVPIIFYILHFITRSKFKCLKPSAYLYCYRCRYCKNVLPKVIAHWNKICYNELLEWYSQIHLIQSDSFWIDIVDYGSMPKPVVHSKLRRGGNRNSCSKIQIPDETDISYGPW